MKREDLQIGDIVVVETSWFDRPTVHYVVTEVNNTRYLVSFYGDVNCGDRPAGFYDLDGGDLPHGTILVARPTHPHWAFGRNYFYQEEYMNETPRPYFEILYKREDAEKYLD